ncbi:hypothetical protein B0H14DRAFT_2558345 [Mycena olivaceomarginata]|nr:hypothetical protein B0H14DRAFT_2558345 [Mycena olivaceomarginata]
MAVIEISNDRWKYFKWGPPSLSKSNGKCKRGNPVLTQLHEIFNIHPTGTGSQNMIAQFIWLKGTYRPITHVIVQKRGPEAFRSQARREERETKNTLDLGVEPSSRDRASRSRRDNNKRVYPANILVKTLKAALHQGEISSATWTLLGKYYRPRLFRSTSIDGPHVDVRGWAGDSFIGKTDRIKLVEGVEATQTWNVQINCPTSDVRFRECANTESTTARERKQEKGPVDEGDFGNFEYDPNSFSGVRPATMAERT